MRATTVVIQYLLIIALHPATAISSSVDDQPELELNAITQPAPNILNHTEYFERSDEGWHFYNETPPELGEKENVPLQHKNNTDKDVTTSPLDELKSIQDDLENARATAVLNPNKETITHYLEKNQWMMQQAAIFADTWRRVVWQTPSLDYSLRRPNNNLALQVFHDQRNELISQALEEVAQEYGIWFFFRGTCAYCHKLAPILKALSKQHGLQVMPIALDGGTLPEYPNPVRNRRVATELGVESVPSIFLVDPKQRSVIPIANGFVSYEQLKERIYILTRTEPGIDF